jgi:hypothetical protein
MKMSETTRCTAMVAKNANNTTSNMARVLNVVELIEE